MVNNEKAIWADIAQGDVYSNVDGDSCAFRNPDGSISDGVMKNGVCTLPQKEKKNTVGGILDTISHIADAAGNIWGKGGQSDSTTTYNAPSNNNSGGGMSALGIIGIVLGLGVVGFVIYKVANKK